MSRKVIIRPTGWTHPRWGAGNGGDEGNGGDGGSGAEPAFADSFESGDFSHSENGISWGGNRTQIVDDRARTGTYSMRFRWAAGTGGNRETRFDLPGLTEVWLEYYLWVPSNFTHPSATSDNQKLLRIWGGDYSDSDPKAGASFRSQNSGDSYGYFQWGDDSQRIIDTQDESSHWDLFDDSNRGSWIQLRWHFKLASSSGAGDAVLQLWQDGVIQVDSTAGDLTGVSGGRSPEDWFGTGTAGNTLTEGYLMGWANVSYTQETIFYIDDVKFYDEDPGW